MRPTFLLGEAGRCRQRRWQAQEAGSGRRGRARFKRVCPSGWQAWCGGTQARVPLFVRLLRHVRQCKIRKKGSRCGPLKVEGMRRRR